MYLFVILQESDGPLYKLCVEKVKVNFLAHFVPALQVERLPYECCIIILNLYWCLCHRSIHACYIRASTSEKVIRIGDIILCGHVLHITYCATLFTRGPTRGVPLHSCA
jgi:hypothetical protein